MPFVVGCAWVCWVKHASPWQGVLRSRHNCVLVFLFVLGSRGPHDFSLALEGGVGVSFACLRPFGQLREGGRGSETDRQRFFYRCVV